MYKITKKYPSATQAIIGLDKKIIINLCLNLSKNKIVSPIAFNSNNQTIVSGDKKLVKKIVFLCKKLGAKRTINLNINIPLHSLHMKKISTKMFLALKKITFNVPTFPIINNVDVKCEFSSKNIKDALIRQLYNPVRWDEIMKLIISYKIKNIIEIGPGKILSNINQEFKEIQSISLYKNKNFFSNIGNK